MRCVQLEDSLWEGLTDSYVKLPMALTAENLAEQYKLSRQDCDAYALQTQTRWQEGHCYDFILIFINNNQRVSML